MSKGIVFKKSVLRWLLVRLISPRFPSFSCGSLSCIDFTEVQQPILPTPEWVRIKPVLSGICGSDTATIMCKGSPYFSPLTSTPFILGHEVVGVVKECGNNVPSYIKPGMRVVVEPALSCVVRGINPPCELCSKGMYANCLNVTTGSIKEGIQTGYCNSTGGGWSQAGLVAHYSQIHPVPDDLEDSVAVLAEPLACAIHGVMPLFDISPRNILVIGCGTLGLLSIAAFRILGGKAKIVATAKYAHQIEFAKKLGADNVVKAGSGERLYQEVLNILYGENYKHHIHKPEIGKPTVLGGFDCVIDCVGNDSSIDDALRLTIPTGHTIILGMPSIPRGIDWTTIWYKSLNVRGSYAYGVEKLPDGTQKKTIQIALECLAKSPDIFRPLVSRIYPLAEYKKAIMDAIHAGRTKSVKIAFRID